MFAIPVANPRTSVLEFLCRLVYTVVEYCVSVVAILLVLPIIIVLVIRIRFESPGPALFFHRRAAKSKRVKGSALIGRADVKTPDGTEIRPNQRYWVPRPFYFIKFRTMFVDAPEKFQHIYVENTLTQQDFRTSFYKLNEHDPRLTKFGAWLRRTTLDELPNLWHVLTGECRLVGPRPETFALIKFYSPEEMTKFTVTPGITCLSKIRGRGELSIGEQIDLDLEYVRNRSVALDVKIICETAWAVVTQRGAF